MPGLSQWKTITPLRRTLTQNPSALLITVPVGYSKVILIRVSQAAGSQVGRLRSTFNDSFLLQRLHGRSPDDELLESALHAGLVRAIRHAVLQLGACEHV